tara:strand:+ start:712 stop:936 length:225 start_codon:yes stop_codon:yes gene_type:complete
MSDENNKEQSAEEIVAEMQELMQRQMELQAKLLKSNWNGFNDALGAVMEMFSGLQRPQTEANNKENDGSQEDKK